ncbi:XTP/dITP diphosphohydrolase [Scopulibacillus daqui]|uniref:dITP/XTP pyrophosphatase n=1 Tax=Scopulibacillus daqui TaxID=1469162 RepID=A0ABS2PYW4_9BACL|nr:XTP/dITP diphosphatase [Scopulibacillus daqui]MBM7644745.1 XTP/dITP diphosphohydrolase [Scopulibacillus daqui]
MKKLLIASNNEGKIKEFKKLFRDFDVQVSSLRDLEQPIDIPETGTTFHENAKLKAEGISNIMKTITIADDSGLVIDALDGRPGVFSARFAGTEKNDDKNIDKVLEELKNVPMDQRTARFVCVLAISAPGKETRFVEGVCEGIITEERIGNQGFGYDPIFYLPELGRTMAELSSDEKNKISHRAQAMQKLMKYWPEWMEGE